MADRPTGTVTFLFTDVEGSTRLWEEHPGEMRASLERHDQLLRSAIEGHGGYVFSTAGDAFAAAFARAGDAVAAAVAAQRGLAVEPWPEATTVRVRMGLHTGEAQERGGDYFGSVLSRAARVMAAGHGGQVLVGALTASVVDGVDLVDLGEHRLKDLSGVERLFQVRADGVESEFPPLRTVDAIPGNLPSQATSFVGRDVEVKELCELVRAHRLVTLTGVGGVGKTCLAVQVAAELLDEFDGGVWLVELAPVGDPGSVPDAVATALGVTPQAGRPMTDCIAEALSGRRLLLVLDNCEHVVDAAADLVDTILARTSTVRVIATSREGLRVGAERLWSVPSLDVGAGADSAAVELFVERAQAVAAEFSLSDFEGEVTEICRRLDGIALGIELAAARMVSMNPTEVRDRLGDRFRLLSGSRRGLERHQTLRHAVAWSYDLLEDEERDLLDRCSVFADGFDLAAATDVCGVALDEYVVLDLLDSLVRKSLVTTEQVAGHTRYGLLETIRQYAEEQLAAGAAIDEVRDRHARYYAEKAVAFWDIWLTPDQRVALDWVEVEFANLRSGFRWATDNGDLVSATAIAAHTVNLAWSLQLFEPIGWAVEILKAATAADIPQLPRLYCSASLSMYIEGGEIAVGYAEMAVMLEADPRYDPFEHGWSAFHEAVAYIYVGQMDRTVELATALAAQPRFGHVAGLAAMVVSLPAVGLAEQARLMADETLEAARELGNALFIALALHGFGRAFADTDPALALTKVREGLDFTRETKQVLLENTIARDAAGLEALHGERGQALKLFDTNIDSFHRSGSTPNVAATLASLTVFLDRIDRPEIAATVYGTTAGHAVIEWEPNLSDVLEHLRSVLGETEFDSCVATGAAMEFGDAVLYARHQIKALQIEPGGVAS